MELRNCEGQGWSEQRQKGQECRRTLASHVHDDSLYDAEDEEMEEHMWRLASHVHDDS